MVHFGRLKLKVSSPLPFTNSVLTFSYLTQPGWGDREERTILAVYSTQTVHNIQTIYKIYCMHVCTVFVRIEARLKYRPGLE